MHQINAVLCFDSYMGSPLCIPSRTGVLRIVVDDNYWRWPPGVGLVDLRAHKKGGTWGSDEPWEGTQPAVNLTNPPSFDHFAVDSFRDGDYQVTSPLGARAQHHRYRVYLPVLLLIRRRDPLPYSHALRL
jgi:hypothetical protein